MRLRNALLFVVPALLLAPFLCFAQQSAGTSNSAADTAEQVMRLNDKLMAAEVQPDVAFVESVLTDDYTHTHANGLVQTKAKFLEGIKSRSHAYALLDLSDVHARVYGRTVILEGHVHIKGTNMGKQTGEGHNLFSEVWVQQGGKWRLAQWLTLHLPKGAADPQ
jgi:ketosteroid isomerase-like protein